MSSDDDDENVFNKLDPDEEAEYIGHPRLIAIIGDEDTCCGFILAGIGQLDEYESPNYFVVDQKTDYFKLEKKFLDFTHRPDIGLVLITKEACEKISPIVKQHKRTDPAVMVIPGHSGPFEVELPLAIQNIEEKRHAAQKSAMSKQASRRGSAVSATSLKTIQSHGGISARASTHSIRSNKSLGFP